MNDVTAGVIHDAPMEQEASAPQAESADGVREGEPERHEHHPGLEVHPSQNGAGQDDKSNGGEHALEPDHGSHRVKGFDLRGLQRAVTEVVRRGGEARLLYEKPLAQRRPGLAPEGQQLLPEGHLVGPGDPADDDRRKSVERHEGGVDGPFLFDDASVENDEARHALDPHQRRRHHLPCVISFVQPIRHCQACPCFVCHRRRTHRRTAHRHRLNSQRKLFISDLSLPKLIHIYR